MTATGMDVGTTGPFTWKRPGNRRSRPKPWYEAAGLSSHLDKLVGEHIAA